MPGGLHLEHAGGLAVGDHLERSPDRHRGCPPGEVRVGLDHLHRVVQHRQVPQAQKVHFQQAQLLQGGHGVLADHGLVVLGQAVGVHTGCG